MRNVIVRYRVRPERIAANEALVRAVYDELAVLRPAGLRYGTFQLDDPARFLHLASIEGDGESPLATVEAFLAFVADIRGRCEEPPATSTLHRVGSYRLL